MEIANSASIINSYVRNVENTQTSNVSSAIDKTKDFDSLNIIQNTQNSMMQTSKRSELSKSILDNTNEIANLQQAKQVIQKQLQTITTINYTVDSSVTQTQLDNNYSKLAQLTSSYNSNVPKYESLNEIYEEITSGESRTYFDGIPGALPLNPQEIKEATAEQNTMLSEMVNQIDSKIEDFKSDISTKINSEKQKNPKIDTVVQLVENATSSDVVSAQTSNLFKENFTFSA